MNKVIHLLSIFCFITVIAASCEKEPINLPAVTTNGVSNVKTTSVSIGGNITSDGGADVKARGVCWSTNINPTVVNLKTYDGEGKGTFTSEITGLNPGTKYYARAYATNRIGTSYGQQIEFTTIQIIPDGAIFESQIIKRDSPPSGFSAVLIWAQAATMKGDQSQTEKAMVTIDYMKTIEEIGAIRTAILTEEYNYSAKTFSTGEAGLYVRYPKWFDTTAGDSHLQAKNMIAYNGFLVIDVSKTPDSIIHWWMPRVLIKPGAKYYAEVKLKVEGKCAVQFGSDYWRDLNVFWNVYDANCITSNNCEVWISDWVSDTKGEFKVLTFPIR